MSKKRRGGEPTQWKEDLLVVSGDWVFWMHDTIGLPMDLTIQLLSEKRVFVDFPRLLERCVETGWNAERAEKRLRFLWQTHYPRAESLLEWMSKEHTISCGPCEDCPDRYRCQPGLSEQEAMANRQRIGIIQRQPFLQEKENHDGREHQVLRSL